MALQLPECFEASYCIQNFCFCEESLVRDTNLHNKDCSEMHSGSCSQMTSSCKCPISLSWKKHWWRTLRRHKMVVRGFPGRVMSVSVLHSSNSPTLQQRDSLILTNPKEFRAEGQQSLFTWYAWDVVKSLLRRQSISLTFLFLLPWIFFAGLSAGVVGLTLSYAIMISGVFQQCVKQSTEVENLVSISGHLVAFGRKTRDYRLFCCEATCVWRDVMWRDVTWRWSVRVVSK